ncbi:MAG: redoxin domain-containing protein [Thermodesulfobacteriota bacterium]|nr:redoxin domain-containing protein [Thermodesulfobacteriota bacterium]
MKKCILHTIGWVFLICFICPFNCSAEKYTPLACGFSLRDQYGKIYEITYPREKVCILVFADKWGCTQVEGWVRPLYEKYGDKITILGVAQLENVPRWLKSTITRIFKHTIKFPVMMDWTGNVSRAYEYTGRKAYVVIISREGNIQYWVDGRASEKLLRKCCGAINNLKPGVLNSDFPENPKVKKN